MYKYDMNVGRGSPYRNKLFWRSMIKINCTPLSYTIINPFELLMMIAIILKCDLYLVVLSSFIAKNSLIFVLLFMIICSISNTVITGFKLNTVKKLKKK